MLSINLPPVLEERLQSVVQASYHGDLQAAISAFLTLHEKYGWKEQLRRDVTTLRAEIQQKGGIKEKTIEDAVKRYRQQVKETRG